MCVAGTGSAPRHRSPNQPHAFGANCTTVPGFASDRRAAGTARGTPVAFSSKRHAVAVVTVTAFRTRDCARQFTRWRNGNEVHHWSQEVRARRRRTGLAQYALLVALIALVSVTVIGIAGTNVKAIFTSIGTALAPRHGASRRIRTGAEPRLRSSFSKGLCQAH
jgi:hypothetical protein